MRPMNAVILTINKKTGLKIRTESGLIATLPYNKKYNTGQSILVSYDFTKNKVIGVLEHREGANMFEIEEPKEEGELCQSS